MQALAWIAEDEHEYMRAATLIGATETLWHDLGGPTVVFPRLLSQQSECDGGIRTALGMRKYGSIRARTSRTRCGSSCTSLRSLARP